MSENDGSGYQRIGIVPAENAELTHVGLGTPMGEMLRRYWHPVCLSVELDDLPKKIRILDEELIAFRDGSGHVGVMDLHCMHRGASLEYGRIEEDGLRCCYHGWKFDTEGHCLDQPGEPLGSDYKDKVRQAWYPAEERYGLVLGADGETPGWNGFNVLHLAAGRVGGMELGFVPGAGGRDVAGILDGAATGVIDIVFNLGADEIPGARFGQAFVIYLGHHGDAGADRADVILPGAAYTEKDAIWVNTEGRAQHAYQAHFPPGEAREDWTIVRALSEHLGHPLPFDTLIALRDAMAAASPVFAATGQVVPAA